MTKTTADKLNDIQRSIDLNEKSINEKAERIIEEAKRLVKNIEADMNREGRNVILATLLMDDVDSAYRWMKQTMEYMKEYQTELSVMKDIVTYLGEDE